MVLLIDNYDSFSYNLYQLIGSIDRNIKVARNDEITVDEIKSLAPDFLVISPGPGKPSDAGICVDAVKGLCSIMPILGICLGHQAIYEAFGGTVSYASRLMHGKSSMVTVDTSCSLFRGLPQTIQAARYHSLAGIKSTLPDTLKITAWTQDDEIMAVCHKKYPVYGLQFHPESILTPEGKTIIRNFLGG
ncbi:MAG: aminodeoxychorismate/anthranilate synthase component II [Treponema sp.]|jgi:anthranilate synthase component 2|nr:aminodeoxychorismate/anthranilate synthase component II [Treponema sp.]